MAQPSPKYWKRGEEKEMSFIPDMDALEAAGKVIGAAIERQAVAQERIADALELILAFNAGGFSPDDPRFVRMNKRKDDENAEGKT